MWLNFLACIVHFLMQVLKIRAVGNGSFSLVKDCPVACECSRESHRTWNNHNITSSITVVCHGTYWTHVPVLPAGFVTILHIESPNIKSLPDYVFDHSMGTNLNTIHLSETEISKIGRHAFWNVSNLVSLRISGKLTHLRSKVFENQRKMENVDLRKNILKQVPEAICDAHNIIRLYLIENKLETLHIGPCFKNLTNLQELYFGSNPVATIEPHDFKTLKKLSIKVLDLSGCQLSSLDHNVLEGFSQLKLFNLQNNRIKFLGFQFSHIFPAIIHIQLDGNRLTKVSGTLFANLTNLEILSLQWIGLRKVEFPTEFLKLTRLSQISLSGNHLYSLSNYSFTHLRDVSLLALMECKLSQISAGAFEPFFHLVQLNLQNNNLTANAIQIALYGLRKGSTFQRLKVSGNHMSDLNNETFQHLRETQMKHLTMSYCEITVIVSGVFRNLPYLETLDMSKNRITYIFPNAFPCGNMLSSLTLTSNRLYSIPDVTSINSEHLEQLYLGYNDIQSVGIEPLMGYRRLKHLILRGNNIKLQNGCFNSSFALEILDLRSNKITRDLKTKLFGLRNLRFLYLGDNDIPNISFLAFSRNLHLNYLELAGNRLLGKNMTSLSESWSHLVNLEYLDLSRDHISHLPNHIFFCLTKLQYLLLSNNDLTNWNPIVFKKQQKLQVLALNHNKLTSVRRKHFQYLASLRRISLSGNPFTCTCILLSLMQWIEHPRGVYFSNVEKYTCETPKKWAQKSLLEFKITQDDCESYIWLDIIMACGILYMFWVTLLTVAYRNRWYIRFVIVTSLLPYQH